MYGDYELLSKHFEVAEWFTDVFGTFDFKILEFYNTLHETGIIGKILDVFFTVYTHLGDEGIIFILLGLIFLFFRKTRKSGFGMLFGMLFGLFFTNIFLKELIERPRPFILLECLPDNESAILFREWWIEMGEVEASFLRSFPSGHTTSAFAAMVPLFLIENKKYSWTALIAALLMGASRNYVMVHYPSDVLGGIIIGAIAGILGLIVINLLYKKVFIKDNKFCNAIREGDFIETIRNKKKA